MQETGMRTGTALDGPSHFIRSLGEPYRPEIVISGTNIADTLCQLTQFDLSTGLQYANRISGLASKR